MKKSNVSVIEIYTGFSLIGPNENLKNAKGLAIKMQKEMRQTYKEYMGFSNESAAMDARDDIFFNEYEEKFKDLGYLYTENEED